MFEIKHYLRSGGHDALVEKTVILLLCGGDKRSQGADITKACDNLRNWQRRAEKQEDGR